MATRLSAADIAAYHRDGFLVLPPLTDAVEIARLVAIYDRHFAARTGRGAGRQFDLLGDDADAERPNVPQILGLSEDEPALRETTLWRNAIAVFTALFGTAPDYVGDHAILKPPRCAKATPWHQDEAYWATDTDSFAASLWIPLQDVDERNGCMHFVPRSHWGEMLPHRSEGGDTRVHGLELDGDFSELLERGVVCPLPAGGATIHHVRTLHYTTANASDAPRRAWILVGGLHPRRRHVPRAAPWRDAKRTARAAREEAHRARVG